MRKSCHLCYFFKSYKLLRPTGSYELRVGWRLILFHAETQKRKVFTSYQLLIANYQLLTVNSVTFVTFFKSYKLLRPSSSYKLRVDKKRDTSC